MEGWFEASPLPPLEESRNGRQRRDRTEGEGPGPEDAGGPGSHNTAGMQGGI